MTINDIVPVPCPRCGEAQNTCEGDFDRSAEPFGEVNCMVCGYVFKADEYRRRAAARIAHLPPLKGVTRPGA